MGIGLGTRSFYAVFGDYVFQFESKRTRDTFCKGGFPITATEANEVSYIGRVYDPKMMSVYPRSKKYKRRDSNGKIRNRGSTEHRRQG